MIVPLRQLTYKLFTLDFALERRGVQGEKVATYDQALQMLKGTKTRPVIELKENGFEEKVVEGVRNTTSLTRQLLLTSMPPVSRRFAS